MNIFIREFKANLKAIIIWLVSLSTIHFVASIEFGIFASDPSITSAMGEFDQLFEALGSTVTDITTPEGFLSLLSIYIILPLAIYSGLLGSGIISKEEKNKTAEFMFTLPISRKKVLLNKLLLAITNSVILNLGLIIVIILAYLRYDTEASFYTFLFNISLGTFFVQLIFMSIGVALSSVLKYYKQSSSITITFLITTFMISVLIGFVEDVEFLKYITPFKYFSADLMLEGTFKPIFLLLTVLFISLGVGTLFIFYPKRDLYI